MCGIAAAINYSKYNTKSVIESLFHRGPDEQCSYKYKNVDLIHTRLSIQDIKNGSQPYHIGNYCIIFNGEIYNHLSLRSYAKKYNFKSKSDTETFLALFIELGISFLDIVDGMFAFVILDKKKREIFFGRDRVGKKPLYFYKDNERLFIASELNTFKTLKEDLTINTKAIEAFFRCGFIPNEYTAFNKIHEVSPGHVYKTSVDNIKIIKKRYFSLLDVYSDELNISRGEILEETDQILRRSIKSRLLSSDKEVGVFLSGGIDSSLITAIASEFNQNIKTFTVNFDSRNDEVSIANKTSRIYSTNHHNLPVRLNLSNDIEKIISAYGEPFMDSSAIPSYYISKEAKKYVSVILNGDGADEFFGGYRRYIASNDNLISIIKKIKFFKSLIPNPKTKSSKIDLIHRGFSLSMKTGIDYYLSSTNDIFEDFIEFPSDNIIIKEFSSHVNEISKIFKSKQKQLMYLDSQFLLPYDLLKKMDIATMANSLEARSPFLSKYFLEWIPRIPVQNKIRISQTKSILRDLTLNYSLKHVQKLPKKGFEVPLNDWVNGELKEHINDLIKENRSLPNYFDMKFINDLIDNKIKINFNKRSKMLWTLFTYSVWEKSLYEN